MHPIFILLVFVAVFFLIRALRGGVFSDETPFQCKTCRHCRKLFDDGVRCGFGTKETFKTPAQIGMCPDHERR